MAARFIVIAANLFFLISTLSTISSPAADYQKQVDTKTISNSSEAYKYHASSPNKSPARIDHANYETARKLVLQHATRQEIIKLCAPCPHWHSQTFVVPIFGFVPLQQKDYEFGFVNHLMCKDTAQEWYCRKCKVSFYPYSTDQLIMDDKK